MSKLPELVLASASPRRETLLREAGFRFQLFPVKVSENLEKNLTVEAQIQRIAYQKWCAACEKWSQTKGKSSSDSGHSLSTKVEPAVILTADTMVVYEGQALGKPQDSADAIRMLTLLSGRTHFVMTALCLGLSDKSQFTEKIEISEVQFRPILRHEIEAYVATGDPFDKAGGYGIQGEAKKFVQSWTGEIENIIGLPKLITHKLIAEFYGQNNWSPPFAEGHE